MPTTDTSSVHTQRTSLRGKNVLVSGGTTGNGRAIAALLAAEGANVFIFGRKEEELRTALEELKSAAGKVAGITADQSRGEDVERVYGALEREFGPVDILVNNAGLALEEITAGDEQAWRYGLETNLFGYIDCARRAIAQMDGRAGAHIVNIGSISAENYSKGMSLYVATKSAIRGFSFALKKELADRDIRVSLIEPGLVGTEIFEPGEEEADHAVQREEQRRGAMLKAEDIAVAVHYCLTQPRRCNISLVRIEPLQES